MGEPRTWSWGEAHHLAGSTFNGDIQCVTRWSKLGVDFAGVSLDALLDQYGYHDYGDRWKEQRFQGD